MPGHTNCIRTTISLYLLRKFRVLLSISDTNHGSNRQRLAHSLYSRKRSISIFCLPLYAHWTRNILQIFSLYSCVVSRSYSSIVNYSCSFYRLCSPREPNIILRRLSNHKFIFRSTLSRPDYCPVYLRRRVSRYPYHHSIFYVPFYYPIYYSGLSSCAHHLPPSDWF